MDTFEIEIEGKVICITNLKRKSLDKALLSRCPSIEINFDVHEMIDSIKKMYQFVFPEVSIDIKKEVFEYIMTLYKKDKNIEMKFMNMEKILNIG